MRVKFPACLVKDVKEKTCKLAAKHAMRVIPSVDYRSNYVDNKGRWEASETWSALARLTAQ